MFILSQVLTACEYNSTQSVLLRVTKRLSVQKRGTNCSEFSFFFAFFRFFFVFQSFSFFQVFFRFFSYFLVSFFVEEKVRN